MPSVVQQLCDVHYAAGEIEPGDIVVVKIGALERVLILCEVDRKQLVTPLLDLMNEHGAKPQPRVAQPDTQGGAFGRQPLPDGVSASDALAAMNAGRCFFPECDFASGGVDKRARVGSHLSNAHGTTMTKLGLGRRGTSPGTVTAADPDLPQIACGEAGCAKTFVTAQGRAVHLSRTHGIRGTQRTVARAARKRRARSASS